MAALHSIIPHPPSEAILGTQGCMFSTVNLIRLLCTPQGFRTMVLGRHSRVFCAGDLSITVLRTRQALISVYYAHTLGEEEQHTPPLLIWTTPVARILLHSSHQQPQV